jgi:NAD(P)-dependent dehydrogenase (short-subunit alcohol dehydrogenase family)
MLLESGQVAVVTGAASGIGFAMAEEFAGRGLGVVLADVEETALAAAGCAIEAAGVPTLAVRTDVRDATQVDELARRTLERFGRVDVVCNNAGVDTNTAPTWEMDILDWKWVMDVNLWGCIHGIRAFVPHLVEQGRGHVVNTASMAGLRPLPFLAPYCASKHAIVGLSETLRVEFDQRGIDVGVTILCPSLVHTKIGSSARNRPPELTPAGPQTQDGLVAHLSRMEDNAKEPPEVARLLMEAIEANRLYLATHSDAADGMREWFAGLIEDVQIVGDRP